MARPDLNPLEREFLDASRELHQREERDARARARRLRLLATVASALFVVAAVVGGLAVLQWRSADQARNQAEAAAVEAILSRLETEIPLLLKTDRSLAFALAAQAHKLQPGARTDSLLNLVLGDDPRYLGRIFPSEPTLAGYDVSPDGKYIALRNTSGLLELYDATTRVLIHSVQGEPTNLGSSPSFLPDGKSIVSVSYDAARQLGTLVVRTVPTLAELRRFEFPAARSGPASRPPAPDGRLPVVVNGVLHLLDLADGADRTVSGLPPLVGGVRFDPRGRYLAAQPVSPRDTLGLFDARTFALLRTFPQGTFSAAAFLFTPDGNLLIGHAPVVSGGSRVELWNPETGELLATAPTAAAPQTPGTPALDSTGARLAVATAVRELGVLSLPGLEAVGPPFPLLTINFPFPKFGPGDRTIYNLALAYALEHWDLSGAGLASAYTAAAGPGQIGFAPDGSWFVKQSPDGHWSRWRLPGFTLMDRSASSAGETTLPQGGSAPPPPVVSADGKYFATGHSDCPRAKQGGCAGSVVIWEAATGRALGQPVRVPNGESANPLAGPGPIGLAFHPDLPLLAIHGTDNLVIIVTLEGGSPRVRGSFTTTNNGGTLTTGGVAFLPSAVAPSPTIITIFGGTLSVWDVSGEVATRLGGVWETSASTRGWAVTPAGTVALLRSTGDLQFHQYEALLAGAEPEPLSVIRGVAPLGVQATLRFAPDGRTMALMRSDGKVVLWDLEKQASIGASFAPPGATSAYPARDSKSLLVASDDTTILWNLDTKLWAEKVCLAAGRNLTEAEWVKYFPGRDYQSTCERWPAKPKT